RARSMVPSPSTRSPWLATFLKTPALTSSCGPTLEPFSNLARSLTLIVVCFFLKTAFEKPRFGMRRCSGICPPSKPLFWELPERDHIPLLPRAAVLPCPLPGPRPILFVLCVDPGSGFSVLMPDIKLTPKTADERVAVEHVVAGSSPRSASRNALTRAKARDYVLDGGLSPADHLSAIQEFVPNEELSQPFRESPECPPPRVSHSAC